MEKQNQKVGIFCVAAFFFASCATSHPPAAKQEPRENNSAVSVHPPSALNAAAASVGFPTAKAAKTPTKNDGSDGKDIAGGSQLARSRFVRQVQMLYRLNLFQNNGLARQVAKSMKPHEDRLRACYSDRLEDVPGLSGDIAFEFKLSKATATLSSIRRTGGKLQDKVLVDCLVSHMLKISVESPRSMRGRLDYVFNFTDGAPSVH